MTALLAIKESINKTLEENFKDIEIYSSDVKEGFSRPSFFTKIIPAVMGYDTKNYTSHSQMVVIHYFSESEEEVDSLKIYDKLIKAFGMTLQVGERHFLCKNTRGEIVDKVLQFRFDIDYMTMLDKEDTHELAKYIDVEIIKE